MNIKGVFQIWMKDGSYHEIDLKECHGWTRNGLQELPRLRGRARRHLDRRHRHRQRLDAHDRAHRARRGGHRPDDRRRHDHRPPRAGGRGGDAAAPSAVDRQPAPLAGTRPTPLPRSVCRRRRRRPTAAPPSRTEARPPAGVQAFASLQRRTTATSTTNRTGDAGIHRCAASASPSRTTATTASACSAGAWTSSSSWRHSTMRASSGRAAGPHGDRPHLEQLGGGALHDGVARVATPGRVRRRVRHPVRARRSSTTSAPGARRGCARRCRGGRRPRRRGGAACATG